MLRLLSSVGILALVTAGLIMAYHFINQQKATRLTSQVKAFQAEFAIGHPTRDLISGAIAFGASTLELFSSNERRVLTLSTAGRTADSARAMAAKLNSLNEGRLMAEFETGAQSKIVVWLEFREHRVTAIHEIALVD